MRAGMVPKVNWRGRSRAVARQNVDVQIAALVLVEKNVVAEWKPAVVKRMARPRMANVFRRTALYRYCSPLERIEIHIAKMTDPDAKLQ
jgi:hypothetical protein